MHDPNQVFVVYSCTREDIAGDLNEAIKNDEKEDIRNIPLFTPDDPRLTDEFCQGIVDGLNDAVNNDTTLEKEYEVYSETVAGLV
jgi:hypothetical protein